jgi:hypothetical protein
VLFPTRGEVHLMVMMPPADPVLTVAMAVA